MGMLLRASVLLYRYRMMQLMENLIYSVLLLACFLHFTSAEDTESRDEKLISTFQIVRFPNDVCVGSNSRNGTCYTSAECSDKDGTSAGSCADGFGVCCTFITSTCGSSTSENNTYWTQPSTVSSGNCAMTVCPMTDDICSLRLDFTAFVITGPNLYTQQVVRRRFGQAFGDLADTTYIWSGSAMATQCTTDSFAVSGASPSSAPPQVCGTLTGVHMYVEADTDRCNYLNFALGDSAAATIAKTHSRGVTTLATREWDITISQIECTSLTLPPTGCHQYFWSGNANVESYNYQSAGTSLHLSNQHQRICIRRERGKCVGCFAAVADAGFMISG